MLRETINRPVLLWKEKDVYVQLLILLAVGTVQKTEENKTCERIQWKEGY